MPESAYMITMPAAAPFRTKDRRCPRHISTDVANQTRYVSADGDGVTPWGAKAKLSLNPPRKTPPGE